MESETSGSVAPLANSQDHERSVTYEATWPGGIKASTTVTAQWAMDFVNYEHGHPVHGYAGALHEKRPPSSIELMLLDLSSRQQVMHNEGARCLT